MLNFIGSPSIYGTIDLELQSQFESKYGHSLYENSTRFLNLQKGKIIPLDTNERGQGRVIIHFSSPSEADWLVQHFVNNIKLLELE